jgi:hypothetical protein
MGVRQPWLRRVPIRIRYTEDGASLLIDGVVDFRKIKICGDGNGMEWYFWIVWLIELKALVGKGLVGFPIDRAELPGRWDNARSVLGSCFKLRIPDYQFWTAFILFFYRLIIFA